MNNSQSSDVFSNSEDCFGNNLAVEMQTDIVTYESLVSKTKLLLSKSTQPEIQITEFPDHFTSLLEDCGACITQSLDLMINLLAEAKVQLVKLCHLMEDAVCLLQMLSNFIKNIIESVSMSCSRMKTFPTTTGHIIMVVFTHCKESETIYGNQLKHVERQLKDLFRNCHDLQLTYLMIIEKHFIFDLSEKDELDLLIEALEINLKIGEIVQTLDVKTMAEQWKAYTMICEKYSDCLRDKHIYHNCTKCLCTMIENDLKTAVELEQDDKVIQRSLKVASFTIKILLKICNIFKHSTRNNHECIVDLLIYMHLNSQCYSESAIEKSPQFFNQMSTNILNPSDILLRELLLNINFINCILNLDINIMKHDDKLLGYILLIVSVIKSIVQQTDDCNVPKQNVINCIFKVLPFGHIWFNMGLKFRIETSATSDYETCGLYEHLLTHALALAATLDSEEIIALEQKMYEALLSTDCYSAMFSSNLWVLLARLSTHQYLLNQLVSVCEIYKKLENNILFLKSPQQIYLSFTMSRLFETMKSDDQMELYKQFNIHDNNNAGLWSVLKIKNLPKGARNDAEEVIAEKLRMEFYQLFTGNISGSREHNKTMKLAATCSFMSKDVLEDCVVKAWMKACPKHKFVLSRGELDRGSMWYLDYIEALVSLTHSMKYIFNSSSNVVKILHVVSNMIEKGNTELNLLLINLVLKISLNSPNHDQNKHTVDSFLFLTFKNLFEATDNVVKNKFFRVIKNNTGNKNIDSVISKILSQDESFQNTWDCFMKEGNITRKLSLKGQLLAAIDFKYSHKCIESNNVIELSDSSVIAVEKTSSNFDFADINTLFDTESDSEPACKKVKMNKDEDDIDEIITRLESDTKLLCKVKENVFTSQNIKKLRKLCEKLRNIVE